jgi:glycerol kinase
MRFVLGIDQGTTQTTAVVIDENGSVVDSRVAAVPVTFPQPGWVEQDPWDLVRTVRETAEPLVMAYPVEAVGFDNQGETFIVWDAESGNPLTPAIVWQDKRGVEVCQALAAQIDHDWLRRTTGLLLDSYFSAPKLRYVLQAQPNLADAARAGRVRFGTTESWVLWHLSDGRLHITDPSTASRTLLFNIQTLGWDDSLLATFGVDRRMLPEVRPSAGLAGEIRLAEKTLPVHALLVDQQAALFGQACFHPGDMKCTFGTGSFLLMNTGSVPRLSQHGLLTTVAWHIDGSASYALDGGVFAAGAAVQWLAESLRLMPDVAASAALAQASTDPGVVVVPALAGLAAPHWKPEVRGAVFGLSRATTPQDLVRATLEGIACRVTEVVRAMEQDSEQAASVLRVDGGPSANAYLMQALADLSGLEVHVAAALEATAVGIASLAAHSALGVSLGELAARWRAQAIYVPRTAVPNAISGWTAGAARLRRRSFSTTIRAAEGR